ncbi:calcium-binding protein [Ancylobacter sp. G4_0304]|uniref:calcium-binding protein n=1 Tax=Ancylobacter sp. G4_0304 TaxID=3114289 RepID=UPI0039C6CEA1
MPQSSGSVAGLSFNYGGGDTSYSLDLKLGAANLGTGALNYGTLISLDAPQTVEAGSSFQVGAGSTFLSDNYTFAAEGLSLGSVELLFSLYQTPITVTDLIYTAPLGLFTYDEFPDLAYSGVRIDDLSLVSLTRNMSDWSKEVGEFEISAKLPLNGKETNGDKSFVGNQSLGVASVNVVEPILDIEGNIIELLEELPIPRLDTLDYLSEDYEFTIPFTDLKFEFEYTLFSLPINVSYSLSQKFTFVPNTSSAIMSSITVEGETRTGGMGDSFSFTAPDEATTLTGSAIFDMAGDLIVEYVLTPSVTIGYKLLGMSLDSNSSRIPEIEVGPLDSGSKTFTFGSDYQIRLFESRFNLGYDAFEDVKVDFTIAVTDDDDDDDDDGDDDGDDGDFPDFVDDTRDDFDRAEQTRSPLVLDLDGDGVETLGLSDRVHFDHDGNGFAELTGWAAADDGLLVFDRNGNGTIDDGTELFGSETLLAGGVTASNGFLALRAMDTNNDLMVDSADANFTRLGVWRDLDGDGVTDGGELFSLNQLGVKSLSIAYEDRTATDADGNRHLQAGTYTTTAGAPREMVDVWFAVDTARTVDKNEVAISEVIAALPDMAGFGNIPSLHQAIARDASGQLQLLVEQYVAENDPTARAALLDDLIYRWAGVYDIAPDSRAATQIYGNVIGDARKLATLEALLGDDYLGVWCWGELDANPHGPAAAILLRAYDKLSFYVAAQLDRQSHSADLYGLLEVGWDEATSGLAVDVTAVTALLRERYLADPVGTLLEMQSLALDFRYGGLFGAEVLEALRAAGDPEGDEFSVVLFGIGRASTVGDGGNNNIDGSENAEVLLGLGGDDALYGAGGDDTLIGGRGNDYLVGGAGGDTYSFSRGDGRDTINNGDGDGGAGRPDILTFGEDVGPGDVVVRRDYYDLVLEIAGTSDSVRIYSFANEGGATPYAIDEVRFADGTVWTIADIMTWLNRPSEGADYLTGSNGADQFDALGGSDIVEGRGGNDVLSGGADDDWLYGGGGDDTLDGGSGSDWLEGGAGSDTYRFEYGWGQDTINNYNPWSEAGQAVADVIVFGEGVSAADMLARRQGDALVLVYANDDRITIGGHFYGNGYEIREVRFADGEVWTSAEIAAMVRSGTERDDDLVGTDGADVLDGKGGNDEIEGGDGNDSLTGGEGNDWLRGSAGSDTYRFNLGWGNDRIDNADWSASGGTDTIDFGAGISTADISVRREWSDLVLIHANGDRITVSGHFYGESYRIDQVRFANGTVWNAAKLASMAVAGTAGDDYLVGESGADALDGKGGDDTIEGGAGNDTLTGGAGDDRLTGGAGSDVYRFNLGWGADVIDTSDWSWPVPEDKIDAIVFGAGIVAADIVVRRDAGDLVLEHADGDRITVSGHFYGESYRIDQVRFADGKVWSAAELAQMVLAGSDGADYLVGGDEADTLDGRAGNDTIQSGGGDDILIGGAGDDELTGGAGSDVYRFQLGWGNDRIQNASWSGYGEDNPDKIDAIVFGAGIFSGDISVRREWNDLVLVHANGDRIAVSSHFYDGYYAIDEVRFADGEVWDIAELESLSKVGTEGDDELTGGGVADVLDGKGGNDSLDGGAGDDRLTGGAGDDFLTGGAGSDRYLFSAGWGNDTISNYDWSAYSEPGAGPLDTIEFDASVSRDGVGVRRQGSDLVLTWGESDRILVSGHFYYTHYAIDAVRFADGTVWDAAELQRLSSLGTEGSDWLTGGAGHDALDGKGGADTIYSGDGNDVLIGGAGNDYLSGGSGSDEYRFATGWGQDTINNYDWSTNGAAARDVIVFGTGILAGDIRAVRQWSDLLLLHANGVDRIVVDRHFDGDDFQIDEVRFADGTVWTAEMIVVLTQLASDGADELGGGSVADTLDGKGGDDTLFGNGGPDILIGGAGDDYLRGDQGADTYRFAVGWGRDTIDNYDWVWEDALETTDKIVFEAGIAPGDIRVRRDGNALNLSHINGADKIAIQNHFYADHYQIDEVRFADGTVWDVAELLARSQLSTSGDDNIQGGNDADELEGQAGNDVIGGGDGDDTLIGGTGNDILSGDWGSDTYRFAAGWGQETINNYDWSDVDEPRATDAIVFETGVAPGDIRVRRDGSNLVLSHTNGIDNITVFSHFYSEDQQIDEVRFADGTVWDVAELLALTRKSTSGDDTIEGGDGPDELDGQAGNDVIGGGDGDDTLIGGTGNDTLSGDWGSDTYRFAAGWGQDTIDNYDWIFSGNPPTTDVIVFGTGIAPGDIKVRRDWYSLVLTHSNGTDKITIQNHFYADYYQIDEVRFGNGTVWNVAKLFELSQAGSSGDDVLEGGDGGDTLDGKAGDDNLSGAGGDDTLIGGTGNDTLSGGEGADTYRFAPGWGRDVVNDYDWTFDEGPPPTDEIVFATGIAPGDIQVRRDWYSLVLTHINGTDKITIQDHFYAKSYQIDEVRFADGTVWDVAQLQALTRIGSAGDDELDGSDSGETLDGKAGDDTLYGYGGDDILIGGSGDDYLSGDAGSDIYRFAAGWGADEISDYEYLLNGGVAGKDAIVFDAGIALGDLSFRRDINALMIEHRNGTDSIKVYSQFGNPNFPVEQVRFADGSAWTVDALLALQGTGVAPVITSNGGGSAATVSLAENKTPVTTVVATDADAGSTRSFSIAGGADAATFAVNASTGALSFKVAPNFEAPADSGANNVYNVVVRVTDNSGLFDEQALAVTITNVNEAPVITSNGGGASAAISLAENRTAVTTATATDPEKGAVTWSISGTDAALFSIDAKTGAVAFKKAPDFEAPTDAGKNNVYDVTIKATDPTKASSTQALKVTVTNASEAPVITSNGGGASAAISLAENRTAVTTATATDPEKGAVTWSISGTDAALFSIDAKTGALAFKKAPDFEAPTDAGKNNVYDVTIKATDSGKLSDIQALKVAVTNVNEAPVITSSGGASSAAVKIAENGVTALAAKAADPEKGAVTWALAGGADAGLFVIDAKTGVLSFRKAPDFEAPADAGRNNVYDVTIKASDAAKLADSQALQVSVSDVGGKTFTGSAKADTLAGTGESDTLDGKAGADRMSGGRGNDTYVVDNAGDAVIEKPGEGTDLVKAAVTHTLGADVENLTLTGNVAISGTGNALANILTGNAVANTLKGGAGNDTLNGAAGNDTLQGEAGNDVLYGGVGADRIYGGAGADSFVFKSVSESTSAVAGRDMIFDFNGAGGDRINLTGIDAMTNVANDQAFSFIGTSAFSKKAGELRYQQSGGDTFLYGDVTGDGVADLVVQFDALLSFNKGYFLL